MKATFIKVILLGLSLVACEGSPLDQPAAKAAATVSSTDKDGNKDQNGQNPDDKNGDQGDTSSFPVAIGGASLTCSLADSDSYQASCLPVQKDGTVLKNFVPKEAFYHTGDDAWLKTDFKFNSSTHVTLVSLPASTKGQSVSIALSDKATGSAIADLMVGDKSKPANLVVGGSFDNLRLDVNESNYTAEIYSGGKHAWSLSMSDSSCVGRTAGVFPNMVSMPNNSSPHGVLDSRCTAADNNTMTMAQTLTLTPGHYYVFSFKYQTSELIVNPSKQMVVLLGTQALFSLGGGVSSWQTYKTIIKADTASEVLKFTETHDASIDESSMIDDVIISDLGPSAL